VLILIIPGKYPWGYIPIEDIGDLAMVHGIHIKLDTIMDECISAIISNYTEYIVKQCSGLELLFISSPTAIHFSFYPVSLSHPNGRALHLKTVYYTHPIYILSSLFTFYK
jgi:hypothetical protein